jgi:polysaccharide pyruvyl transferase WcaK-like protein
MRICITMFVGWGNSGDEGTLLAMMDSLGNHEYIVCTNLPYTLSNAYARRMPMIHEVRHIYDWRTDYDTFLLGGGELSWGFGWRQGIQAFATQKPTMNYGVGYGRSLFNPRLYRLYREFLTQFDAVTVRDEQSQRMAEQIGVETTLTMCPSINLKTEKFDCPENMIVVCPRYEDFEENDAQVDWLYKRLREVEDEVLLVPFGPYNREGTPVDLQLCRQLKSKLGHSEIFETDGFSPRKVKYLISRSKEVISGGRYHALVWAVAHDVPFECSPTAIRNYPKIEAFQQMYQKYGGEKLKEMERQNEKVFWRLFNE